MAPTTPGRPSRRRTFGSTWWGKAWIDALEQRARLDPNRLPRGRTYARHSRVGVLTVEPGEVRTSVLGSRSSAYRVRLRIRPFTDEEWEVVLDAISARAAHAAALLDGELSPGIVQDARDAGCDLLPGPGEVSTICSCPDWANPCKHAAAVCYLVADRLDEDPFELLLLRGRGRDAILAGLRSRRAARAAPTADGPADRGRAADPGVVARDAYRAWGEAQAQRQAETEAARAAEHRVDADATGGRAGAAGAQTQHGAGRSRPALPRPPLPPSEPGRPAPLVTDAPPGAAADGPQLAELAADAVRRAWALATGRGDGELSLSRDADLARRAHAVVGTTSLRAMAQRSGLTERQLVRLANTWGHGGADALMVLDEGWPRPADAVEEARLVLAGDISRVRRSGQHLSLPEGVQLRLSPAGRWFPCQRRGGDWEVIGRGDTDPLAAYDTRT